MASENLNENEKHFHKIILYVNDSDNQIIEENTFGHLTFERVTLHGIKIINSNAFNWTANKIKAFYCSQCLLENQPPKYDLQTLFNQMTKLEILSIGLNVTQLSWSILPNGQQKLKRLIIKSTQNLTIKSGAFQYQNYLYDIEIEGTTINQIQNEAFKLDSKSKLTKLFIIFNSCNLTGHSFSNSSFDGLTKQIQILFLKTDINFLNEGTFKSVLNNQSNLIVNNYEHDYNNSQSKIDCNDCRNFWLIKEEKENQIQNAFCKNNYNMTLFDEEITTKLSQLCK